MKGIVRTLTVNIFPEFRTRSFIVKCPYDNLHVFQIKVFFSPNKFGTPVTWQKYVIVNSTAQRITANDVTFSADPSGQSGYSKPLVFYVDPKYKRSDQIIFKAVEATLLLRTYLLVEFSYIDQ